MFSRAQPRGNRRIWVGGVWCDACVCRRLRCRMNYLRKPGIKVTLVVFLSRCFRPCPPSRRYCDAISDGCDACWIKVKWKPAPESPSNLPPASSELAQIKYEMSFRFRSPMNETQNSRSPRIYLRPGENCILVMELPDSKLDFSKVSLHNICYTGLLQTIKEVNESVVSPNN